LQWMLRVLFGPSTPTLDKTYHTYGLYPSSTTNSGLNKKNTISAPSNVLHNYNWNNPVLPTSWVHVQQGCKSAVPPKIDWGICPMLEATDENKKAKEEKQKECIKDLELNENSTMEELSPTLQNRVRECVLRKDGLINEAGKYNYDAAFEKLKAKEIPEDLGKKGRRSPCRVQSRCRREVP